MTRLVRCDRCGETVETPIGGRPPAAWRLVTLKVSDAPANYDLCGTCGPLAVASVQKLAAVKL